MHHGAGGEEEERFEERVIHGVIESSYEREYPERGGVIRKERYRGADAEKDDADVLDARKREEPLHAPLGKRIEDAENRGDRAERDYEHAPVRVCREEFDEEADNHEDGRLYHDAGHEGRDVRRGSRMSLGKPDVKGDDPGFRGKSDKRQGEHSILDDNRQRSRRGAYDVEIP